MADYVATNARKITKAVYLLLQEYHRTMGLAVIGWSKPPGNSYFSFYSMAAGDVWRQVFGRPSAGIDIKRFSLTTYQDHIGLPAWGAGEQEYHPDQRRRVLSTAEIVQWYKSRLELQQLFEAFCQDIEWWRRSYHVGESEPYLLTWNVMGLVSAKLQRTIATYGRSEYYFGIPDEEKDAALELASGRQFDCVHFCGKLSFANSGLARLPNGMIVDLWQRHLRGEKTEALASFLCEQSGRE